VDRLTESQEERLSELAQAIVAPESGCVLVPPAQEAAGYWFGAGNCVRDPRDGSLLLLGRYRDAGDSRLGLAAGPRGRELALFRSTDDGATFAKIRAWGKAELSGGSPVLSIEGSFLRLSGGRVEVLVSLEKDQPYPAGLREYQKPGTGVWSIDRFVAPSVEALDPRGCLEPFLRGPGPAHLHVKDPSVTAGPQPGALLVLHCCHPYTWSSASSGYVLLDEAGRRLTASPDFFPRGPVWDVAAARITCRLPVPRRGAFRDAPPVSLYFYDGAECLRPHEPHGAGVARPRGYSCEELGGVAYGLDACFPAVRRLSLLAPAFVSPHGTGCCRYASVWSEPSGDLFATWQQSAASGAQPLLGHWLSAADVDELLGA